MMILAEGNQKLLEEENLPDLFELIVNNLTLIPIVSKEKEKKKILILAVEHRCFFNEVNVKKYD